MRGESASGGKRWVSYGPGGAQRSLAAARARVAPSRRVQRNRVSRPESLEPRLVLSGYPMITEFMATNHTGLEDELGRQPDWIEIHNAGDAPIDLAGWHLTDDGGDLRKWTFPERWLDPDEYAIVYASGTDDDDPLPGAPLHANFRLSDDGEFLALVEPNGSTIASSYSPTYPPQLPDVSYGAAPSFAVQSVVADGSVARVLVPLDATHDSSDPEIAPPWTAGDFDDATWQQLPLGISLSSVPQMEDMASSLYVRTVFDATGFGAAIGLTLNVDYDDGFVAYLNGVEVLRVNAPDGQPAWDWAANAARPAGASGQYESFDLSSYADLLLATGNVLAIHGLNVAPDDDDFELWPELTVQYVEPDAANQVYFANATPGAANFLGTSLHGPLIRDVEHFPAAPHQADAIVVTATVSSAFEPVDPATVTLHYRTMFDAELSVAMRDDGLGDDALAGDGRFTGTIPPGVAAPGEMLRWYVTGDDTQQHTSRSPGFPDPLRSPEYYGTMIDDPSIVSSLPVLHWFVESTVHANEAVGTRASLYHEGAFYDNIYVRFRGHTSYSLPKRSHKFDMNPGHKFTYSQGMPPVEEFDLNSTYSDKSYVRQSLAWEVYRDAGVAYSESFLMRVHRNGEFYGVDVFVEHPDEDYLDRNALDPNGSLYKIYNGLTTAQQNNRKVTPGDGDFTELQDLITGLQLTGDDYRDFIYDHVDIPALVNYMAANILTGDVDHYEKNHFAFRDAHTGLWTLLPWDNDLSFGRTWGGAEFGLRKDSVWPESFLHAPNRNRMLDAVWNTPELRTMFYRRLRTLLDQFMQTASTPVEQRYFESRLAELYALAHVDAAADKAKWATFFTDYWGNPLADPPGWDFGENLDFAQGLAVITDDYLPARRTFLYGQADLPDAQPTAVGSLAFGAIEPQPMGGNQDQEYIELLNSSPTAFDLSGWRLSQAVDFTFASGTVIPANGSMFVSPDVAQFRGRQTGPSGSQGFLVVGPYGGHLSSFGETIQLLDDEGALVAEATYVGEPSPAQRHLRVSELMFNPADPTLDECTAGFCDNDDFEFIELVNTSSAESLVLDGVALTSGVQFAFEDTDPGSDETVLAPGEHVLVVRNLAAFSTRFDVGGMTIAGEYRNPLDNSNKLSNGGERIKIEDAENSTIQQFSYDDNGAWPGRPDGDGSSLEAIDAAGNYDDPANWRSSSEYGGSPGFIGVGPRSDVVINEVLSNSDAPGLEDAIELLNATAGDIDLGGWVLSDSSANYRKYEFAPGTTIHVGEYLVLTEADFNPAAPDPGQTPFALDGAGGDDVWLLETDDTTGNLVSFVDHVDFGAAAADESFGRWPDGTGRLFPMAERTFGSINTGPRIGPVVIGEVMYSPTDPPAGELAAVPAVLASDFEFVELFNPSPQVLDLGGWRLDNAVDFVFAPGTMLRPGDTLVVLPFDPINDIARLALWQARYPAGSSDALFGPWSGRLNNAGETVQLERPDTPVGDPPTTPWILIDEVRYEPTTPWPAADATGVSLDRTASNAFGNDAASWTAAATPTPGVSTLAFTSAVVGEHVFYANSAFAATSDDGAIATDKTALRPGQSATFANYTNSSAGINGLMIDVVQLPDDGAALTVADFTFRIGNDNTPGGWMLLASPTPVVPLDEGASGADRVVFTWPDETIANTWLEVTVRATAATGLAAADIFYFGNAVGETGNAPTNALVTAADLIAIRDNPRGAGHRADITTPQDINRDSHVNAVAQLLARNNATGPFGALQLITPPLPSPAPVEAEAEPTTGVGQIDGSATRQAVPATAVSIDEDDGQLRGWRLPPRLVRTHSDSASQPMSFLRSVFERNIGALGRQSIETPPEHEVTHLDDALADPFSVDWR